MANWIDDPMNEIVEWLESNSDKAIKQITIYPKSLRFVY